MASLNYEYSDSDSRFLKPIGSGDVDVVNDFAWTKSPKSARTDVPFVKLIEYQQTTGQLGAAMLYYSRVIGTALAGGSIFKNKNPGDVYQYKYIAEPTGFRYSFPYFSTQKHTRKTDFSGENQNPFKSSIDLGKHIVEYGSNKGHGLFSKDFGLMAEASTLVGLGVNVANTYFPGNINFELPQKWQSTTEGSVSVNFTLSNTGTLDDIDNNRNLAYVLTYQNSANRRNFALNDPVVIYSLEIPDVVNFPACYMSELNIQNLGNTRIIKGRGIDKVVPEAYQFDMTFTSLILPTRNIMEGMDGGSPVQAINNVNNLSQATLNALSTIKSTLPSAGKELTPTNPD